MKPLEILLLTVLGGFAAIFLLLSKGYNPTAALFPQWIAIASLLFLAVVVIQLIVRSNPIPESRELGAASRTAIFLVQGAYIAVIYLLGFFPATLVFLLIAPIQMRYKRWSVVVLHGVVLTLALAGSFLWLFNVQLPTGAIWDLW